MRSNMQGYRATIVFLLLAAGCGYGYSQSSQKPATPSAAKDRQVLHVQALGVVHAEDARAKQPLCPKAMSTLEVNECYSGENGKTNANYLKLVHLLGQLLRAGDEAEAQSPVRRIPFDDAETAWAAYREKACTAAGSIYEGGTIRPSIELGCRITVTQHHIDELWSLYNDEGTR